MIRKSDVTNIEESIYGCGECHIHAIAAAELHGGGRFLIIEDYDHVHWETDEDDILCVIHVYSLHEVDGQVIARDVLGDRLVSDAEKEACEHFCLCDPYSYECDLGELMSLTVGFEDEGLAKDGYENPLREVLDELVQDALNEPSVCAPIRGPQKEEEYSICP